MDLRATPEEAALRDEVRDWLRANLPWEYGKGLPPRFDDLAEEVAFGRAWQAKLASGRLVGVAWPEEFGGRGGGPVEHYIVTEELARARAPELVGRIGVNLVGPDPARARDARAEGPLPAAHPRRDRDLVPAVQRARCGQRPDVVEHARDQGRRRLRRQRAEGLDELRAVRRLGLVPRPHRSRRAEEQGHLRARDRHARARRRGPALAPDHRRVGVQRGLLLRRVRARRPAGRSAPRGLAHRELHADARARSEPAPTRRALPAPRRALEARPRERTRSTIRASPAVWPRRSSKSASSSCTTGARSRVRPRAQNLVRSAASTSCGGAR